MLKRYRLSYKSSGIILIYILLRNSTTLQVLQVGDFLVTTTVAGLELDIVFGATGAIELTSSWEAVRGDSS